VRFKVSFLTPIAFLVSAALSSVAHAEGDDASTFEARLAAELGVSGGLTAEALAQSAVASSYSVQARRADVDAAHENLARARAGYWPKLTVNARYTRVSHVDSSAGSIVVAPTAPIGAIPTGTPLFNVPLSFPTPEDQYVLGASLLVPVSDYFLRVSAGESQREFAERAARYDLDSSERAVATNARGLYYAWVGARLSTIVAELALEQAKLHAVDVQHALDAGTASPADRLRVESRIAEAERGLEGARHAVADLEEQIRIARHDPESASYAVGEDVRGELAPNALPESLPELLRMAFDGRPELRALSARSESAARAVKLERAAFWPRFDVFADAQYSNPNPRFFPQRAEFRGTWDAGAQLSWVVTDIPSASAGSHAAEAALLSLRAEARAFEDQIRREVSAALQVTLDARAAVRTTQKQLQAAEESYRVRRALFQNGRATSTELLDAELDLTRARREALAARLEVRMAAARLRYAVGAGQAQSPAAG
jgi:outer membrane protein TolC